MEHNTTSSKYHIVEGNPLSVSAEVNRLLADGWQLHGTLHKMEIATDKVDIVVQAMVK